MNADWWTAMFDKSTDPGNDLIRVQLFLSFSSIFQETSLEMDVKIVNIIYYNFPWSALLSTIEMTSQNVQNLGVKTLACSLWLHLSFEYVDVIFIVDKSTDHGKLLSIY